MPFMPLPMPLPLPGIVHSFISFIMPNRSPFPLGASNSNDTDAMAKVQVVTHPRLVNANEITVQQPTILEHAQPILTNAEKLKRSDEIIMQVRLTK